MVAVVGVATGIVVTLKLRLVAPAGMVTLAGTEAAALSLESATTAPPAGAGPLSDTVAAAPSTPPKARVPTMMSAETAGGSTVSEAL